MHREYDTPVVLLAGIDGSGKTTTAHTVARRISSTHPESVIGVTDTDGLTSYLDGEQSDHRTFHTAQLDPQQRTRSLTNLERLGGFAIGRRISYREGLENSDFLLSVRDHFRIDAALFAGSYCPPFERIAPERRLAIVDKFTRMPAVDAIVHLEVPVSQASALIAERDIEVRPHESANRLARAAIDLTGLLEAYHERFGTPIINCEGLRPDTADIATEVAEQVFTANHHGYPGVV